MAAASLAAGGGSSAQSRAEKDARAAFEGFLHALAVGDGERVCAVLAPTARKQFFPNLAVEDADCKGEVALTAFQLSDAQEAALRRARVRKVSVDGDRAEIANRDIEIGEPFVRTDEHDERPTVLRRVRGRWLIEDFG